MEPQKNNQCPTFLSQENGVTSTVTVENTHSPEVSGAHSVGYLVKTKTTNLRGTTTQEQLLYAVPMGEVVIEVMGMNFGGPVNRREVDEVLQQAVARSSEIHKLSKQYVCVFTILSLCGQVMVVRGYHLLV